MENQKVKHVTDVAVFSGNKTLLVKYKDGNKYDHQQGWFIPDDLMKFGEHPEDAANRILKEQLGIQNSESRLGFIESFTGNDKSWHLVFHYYTKVKNTDVNPSDEISQMSWFTLDALPDKSETAHHGWATYTLNELKKLF